MHPQVREVHVSSPFQLPFASYIATLYAHRPYRAGTPGLPDQVIAMLQSVVDDLKQAKKEQRQVSAFASQMLRSAEGPACLFQGMPCYEIPTAH